MALDLDIVIGSPDYSVEMKAGLKTMQGASDSITTIAETVLTGNVPERKTYRGKVRTRLKESFDGSYGQIFSLEISDEVLKRKFHEIGWEAFSELISYFLNDSVYKQTEKLSEKAQQILDDIGESAEALCKQLRVSAMKNIHDTSFKFDFDVKIRIRKNRDNQLVLAKFDRQTGATLAAKMSRQEHQVTAGITRLNINTGNGRLQIIGENETTAFGFGQEYKLINLAAKKTFSDNLDRNNGMDPDNWTYLKLKARPLELRDGTVIKYIISEIEDV